jgi:hypothetical protein
MSYMFINGLLSLKEADNYLLADYGIMWFETLLLIPVIEVLRYTRRDFPAGSYRPLKYQDHQRS